MLPKLLSRSVNRSYKHFFSLCLAFIFYAIPPALGKEIWIPSRDALQNSPITSIERHLQSIPALQAHFVQTGLDGVKRQGTWYFLRPFFMRWEYDTPDPYWIILNKDRVTVYDLALDSISHAPLEEHLARFLMQEQLALEAVTSSFHYDSKHLRITLQDSAHPEQGSMELQFNCEHSFILDALTLYDAEAQPTLIRFDALQYLPNLPKKLFYNQTLRMQLHP